MLLLTRRFGFSFQLSTAFAAEPQTSNRAPVVAETSVVPATIADRLLRNQFWLRWRAEKT